MGWANCGNDSKGRPIGYAHVAKCDHPECFATIDRGLSYACGGMHGDNEYSCENYFCGEHLSGYVVVDSRPVSVCAACEKTLHAQIRENAGCTCTHDGEWHSSGCDEPGCECRAKLFEWEID